MPAPSASSPPLFAPGHETPVSAIDESLRALWASSDAATKASLINFAVYSEDPGSLSSNTQLIEAITREHACRAILIAADPSEAEPTVRAWITAHCQVSGAGGKSVCSEQITFLLGGRLRDALRNVVFAHLESDLPLVFFWQGDLTERWEPHLYRRIDRLVVDSTVWSDPGPQLAHLREAWKDSASHFVVLDVAWMRIFPFRQALAGAFDVALAREHLCELQRIEIAHAPGHRTSAALLAAWITHKAGWQPDNCERLFTEIAGAPLSKLVLDGDGACRIEITRAPQARFLHATVHAGGTNVSQLSPAISDDLAALLSERLSRGANTALYFTLWRMARNWLAPASTRNQIRNPNSEIRNKFK
jgi:glucose-6-phosphate dehydrogenase assembly protein OpcA